MRQELYLAALVFRSALFYVVLIAFTIIWATVSLFVGPLLSYRQRYTFIINWWTRCVIWWLGVSCNVHYRVEGLENVPTHPCILYSKHQSTWETFFLQTLFTPQCQVIKKELLSIPFFGWAFNLVSPIAIDRGDRKKAMQQVIEQGTSRLGEGVWVLIFPEGTRVDPGKRKPFTRGGARLAIASGYPLLPIAHNAGEHWPNNRFLKYPGEIRVVIGPAIFPEGKRESELTTEGENWINTTVDRISQHNHGEIALDAQESRA